MKPWKIKHVQQKGPTCTIAAMAMIRGVGFDDVAVQFCNPEEGTLNKIAGYLGDYGYSVLIKEVQYHSHPRFGHSELTTIFAPAHILHVKPYADDPTWHVVVMDQRGRLYDPAYDEKHITSLNSFYRITGVLGIWRPEDL